MRTKPVQKKPQRQARRVKGRQQVTVLGTVPPWGSQEVCEIWEADKWLGLSQLQDPQGHPTVQHEQGNGVGFSSLVEPPAPGARALGEFGDGATYVNSLVLPAIFSYNWFPWPVMCTLWEWIDDGHATPGVLHTADRWGAWVWACPLSSHPPLALPPLPWTH